MFNFSNKVVWITGASSGIGEALVYELMQVPDVKLVISSRRKQELERVAGNFNPDNILILPIDLENYKDADVWTKAVLSKFGKIDVLINNGGISQRSWASETPIELDKKLFEINYFGTIALTKAVLPIMLKQKSGKIITISSIAGKFGFYLRTAYSATKHALHGFFDSLRLEVEPQGLTVLLVCPGKIKTSISLNALTEKGEKFNKMDQAHEVAMSAKECAVKIVRAATANKREIYIGGKEIIPVYLKRFVPGLLHKLLKKQKPE